MRIFGPKEEKLTGGWRKLHNKDFHNLYSSAYIVRMMMSKRLGWWDVSTLQGR
jgi:hypothetical protein